MAEEEFDWKSHGLPDDKELAERDARMKKTEEEGIKNTLKHFDRIRDKLFQFNNILIAGYFALAKIVNSISLSNILFPIINLGILLYIEYRMMEKSRFESNITEKTEEEINAWGTSISKTNKYSKRIILTTAIVTVIFLYYLLK
jgi:hypothetical protein